MVAGTMLFPSSRVVSMQTPPTHIRHYVDGRFEGVSAYRQQAIDTETDTEKSIPAVIGKYLHPGGPVI